MAKVESPNAGFIINVTAAIPAPQWSATPAPQFNEGSATETYTVTGFVQGYNAATDVIAVQSGTLPGWCTFNGTQFVASGARTDTSDFGPVVLRVTRSGQSTPSSPFWVFVNALPVSWGSTPSPTFVAGVFPASVSVLPNLVNYQAGTDVVAVQSGSIPFWCSFNGTAFVALSAPTDTDDFGPIVLQVSRSGGAWVSSQPFGVTVIPISQANDYWYAIQEQTLLEGSAARLSLLPYWKGASVQANGGGYCPTDYYDNGIYFTTFDNIHGVSIDWTTMELVYDGTALSSNSSVLNPNNRYYAGREDFAFTGFGMWSSVTKVMPNVTHMIHNDNKHQKGDWVNGKFYLFNGDGITDYRVPVIWELAHATNTWTLRHSPPGVAGKVFPWGCDNAAVCADSTRNVLWIIPGFQFNSLFSQTDLDALAASFGYVGSPRVNKVMTWSPTTFEFTETVLSRPSGTTEVPADAVYDPVDDRIYFFETTLLRWFSCSNLAAGYQSQALPLTIGASGNLSGIDFSTFAQINRMAIFERWLYFLDHWNARIIRVSLPGNAAGSFKIQRVADLPVKPGRECINSIVSQPSMVLMPARRKAVVFFEARYNENVGPDSKTFDVDIDTLEVRDGPRFPAFGNNMPYFPQFTCPVDNDTKIFAGVYYTYWGPPAWPLPQATRDVYHIYSVI